MEVTLGQIVYSKAGRDEGKKFIIYEVLDETYVLVVDGNLRRIEKPKKKKMKHLELTSVIIESLKAKLQSKVKVTNAEVRKSLASDIVDGQSLTEI